MVRPLSGVRVSEPTVCAVMLTKDRPDLARRAVECFRRQTYHNKKLLVYDSGESDDEIAFGCGPEVYHVQIPFPEPRTIGDLRNLANSYSTPYDHAQSDILIHWDDDDWSHPDRIAEQVALLQASGADAVGYNKMLFWRTDAHCQINGAPEAWLYTNNDPRYCLGTSLCYWRKTWEANPFPLTSQGEDLAWLGKLKTIGFSSLQLPRLSSFPQPRMIASIHGGNTSNAYDPAKMRAAKEWRRVPEWDAHCARVMAL